MPRPLRVRLKSVPQTRVIPAWPAPSHLIPPALRVADYRRLWSASCMLFLAQWMDIAILSWVVVQMTDSPFLVSLVSTARIAPFLLAGPFAGLVADRVDRLLIIRVTRVCLVVIAGIFAALLATDSLALWHIYVLVMIGGVIWPFDEAARQSLTPDLVGDRLLTSAIALDMMAFMTAQVAGSALVGVMLPVIHADVFFAVLAGLIGLSVLRLIRVESPGPADTKRLPFIASLAGGLRVVRSNRVLLAVLLMTAACEGFAYVFYPLLPLFATDVLNAGAGGLGLLLAAQGIGALLAGVAVAVAGSRIRAPGRVVVVSMIMTVAMGFALAGSRSLLLTFVLLALQGVFVGTYVAMGNRLVMLLTPRHARGRLVGLQMLVIGAFPISALAVGGLADALTPSAAVMIMSGIGLVLIVALQIVLPELHRYRKTDAGDRHQGPPPSPHNASTETAV